MTRLEMAALVAAATLAATPALAGGVQEFPYLVGVGVHPVGTVFIELEGWERSARIQVVDDVFRHVAAAYNTNNANGGSNSDYTPFCDRIRAPLPEDASALVIYVGGPPALGCGQSIGIMGKVVVAFAG